jgi:hypothetical protein
MQLAHTPNDHSQTFSEKHSTICQKQWLDSYAKYFFVLLKIFQKQSPALIILFFSVEQDIIFQARNIRLLRIPTDFYGL